MWSTLEMSTSPLITATGTPSWSCISTWARSPIEGAGSGPPNCDGSPPEDSITPSPVRPRVRRGLAEAAAHPHRRALRAPVDQNLVAELAHQRDAPAAVLTAGRAPLPGVADLERDRAAVARRGGLERGICRTIRVADDVGARLRP